MGCDSDVARLHRRSGAWEADFFWVFLAGFAVSTIYVLYLLRVRRNDAPFWDEEEARRADGTVGAGSCSPPFSLQGGRR
jgi:hypothetical protein